MNDQVKADNRRALPKFFLIMLASLTGGGVLGFAICFAEESGGAEAAAAALNGLLRTVTPWALPAAMVLLGVPSLVLYLWAKRRFAGWDKEDEEEADAIDMLLNWVLLLGSILLLLSFFFFAAAVWFNLSLLATLVPFFLTLIVVVLLQQKAVDLTKRMNPEKQGSVYDGKFQKKWLDSCDEAERAQIGQAALCAYQTTSKVCLGLWLVLVTVGLALDIGLLPVFLVTLILGVMQVSYIAACIRLGRRKEKGENG